MTSAVNKTGKDLIAKVEQDYGRLDILVNNAAILRASRIDIESLEGWRRVQSVNAEGVFSRHPKRIAPDGAIGRRIDH